MIGHPRQKAAVYGTGFRSVEEWNEETELEWYLTKEEGEKMPDLHKYVRGLLHLYRKYSACYVMDRVTGTVLNG